MYQNVNKQIEFFFQQMVSVTNIRSSPTAEKQRLSCPHGGRGRYALQPTPPPTPLATPMRMVESESHNVRTSSVHFKVKCTLR